ncbi:hypothetical protein DSO57_1026813, partial [Entomophthora muscae]
MVANMANKDQSQSYALFPISILTHESSQADQALLDTVAMGNFVSSSLARDLGLEEEPPAWILSLSNLAFSIILGFPWARLVGLVMDLTRITLRTSQDDKISEILFSPTSLTHNLTPKDLQNIIMPLKNPV